MIMFDKNKDDNLLDKVGGTIVGAQDEQFCQAMGVMALSFQERYYYMCTQSKMSKRPRHYWDGNDCISKENGHQANPIVLFLVMDKLLSLRNKNRLGIKKETRVT
jgi:hypothetical protein